MSKKIVKTKKGDLEYRLPDISEGYEYLALVERLDEPGDMYRARGKIIGRMGDLIEFKALGYNSYEEVLGDKENMREPLTVIAKEIFEDAMDLIRKKD